MLDMLTYYVAVELVGSDHQCMTHAADASDEPCVVLVYTKEESKKYQMHLLCVVCRYLFYSCRSALCSYMERDTYVGPQIRTLWGAGGNGSRVHSSKHRDTIQSHVNSAVRT